MKVLNIHIKGFEQRFFAALIEYSETYLPESVSLVPEAGSDTSLSIDLSQHSGAVRLGSVVDTIYAHIGQYIRQIEDQDIHIGPYVLNVHDGVLNVGKKGDLIKLTDKERDILRTLHNAGTEGVSKQDLLSLVWGFVEGLETHTLETHIYRLRQKIEKDPVNPAIIITTENGYTLSFEE